MWKGGNDRGSSEENWKSVVRELERECESWEEWQETGVITARVHLADLFIDVKQKKVKIGWDDSFVIRRERPEQ